MGILILGNSAAAVSAINTIRAKDNRVPITVVSKEDVPFYSPVLLRYYIQGRISRRQLFSLNGQYYQRNFVKLILNKKVDTLQARNKRVILDDRSTLEYDKLILGIGASPMIPSIKGITNTGVFTLRTLKDADAILRSLRSRVLIIGAGPVSLGVAIALRKRGVEVALLVRRSFPNQIGLPLLIGGRIEIQIAEEIVRLLNNNGVELLLNHDVMGMEIYGDPVKGIKGNNLDYKCDTIIVATGVRPNTEFIDPSEILLGARGEILVDDTMKTSIQDVYAAGDCASALDLMSGEHQYVPLWPNAIEQGKVSGSNVIGKEYHHAGFIKQNIVDIFGKSLFVAGEMKGEKIVFSNEQELSFIFVNNGMLVGCQVFGGHRDFGLYNRMIKLKYPVEMNTSIQSQVCSIASWMKKSEVKSGPRGRQGRNEIVAGCRYF